jgi:hypothetical protein
MPLRSGFWTGVKRGIRISAAAISRFLRAAKIEALSESYGTWDHHVADYLAGDAGAGRDSADRLAVVMVRRESDAQDLAGPADELQHVRASAGVRADCRHPAFIFARPSASGMAFEQEGALLH